jgi:hypothetical protein
MPHCLCLCACRCLCVSSNKHSQQCYPADILHMGHPYFITLCCPVGIFWQPAGHPAKQHSSNLDMWQGGCHHTCQQDCCECLPCKHLSSVLVLWPSQAMALSQHNTTHHFFCTVARQHTVNLERLPYGPWSAMVNNMLPELGMCHLARLVGARIG